MRTLLISLFLCLPIAVTATTYRWKDADGNTVFSQTAPSDGRDASTVRPPPSPAETPQAAQKRLQNQIQKFEDSREDKRLLEEKRQQNTQKKAVKDENCRRAQKNLSNIQQKSRQLINDGTGQYRRYSVEEKNNFIKKTREIIKRDCT